MSVVSVPSALIVERIVEETPNVPTYHGVMGDKIRAPSRPGFVEGALAFMFETTASPARSPFGSSWMA